MLEGKACATSVDVSMWMTMARTCGDEVPRDLSRS